MNEITNGVNEIAKRRSCMSRLHCEIGEGLKAARET